jgi:DNA-directed RNA polymerase specialized sigma24 family protein
LYVYLRALLPAAHDALAAFRETVERIRASSQSAPSKNFVEWAESIARQVALDRRKACRSVPFSDDLFRQLADSVSPSLSLDERRPAAIEELWGQLPQPEKELLRRKYELGMTTDQIAVAEDRSPTAISREMTALHASLVNLLRQSIRDPDLPPPGGASDLGRLTDQLLDGTINDDGRLILETLLLADAAAQAHYHRHVAMTCELTWKHRGLLAVADLPETVIRKVSVREWVVTIAFLLGVVGATVFLSYVVYIQVR